VRNLSRAQRSATPRNSVRSAPQRRCGALQTRDPGCHSRENRGPASAGHRAAQLGASRIIAASALHRARDMVAP